MAPPAGAEAAAGAGSAAGAGDESPVAAAGAAEVARVVAGEAPSAKAPPDAAAGGAAAAGLFEDAEPEPVEGVEGGDALDPLLPPPLGQVPVGAFKGKFKGASVVTYLPGSGNWRLVVSVVPHPLPMLAVNIEGRLSIWPVPPEMATLAQFMYISRLPMLLNHVHASVAAPLLTSWGIVKVRF
jgi:hypothetical protein